LALSFPQHSIEGQDTPGHSLRAGFLTLAAGNGASIFKDDGCFPPQVSGYSAGATSVMQSYSRITRALACCRKVGSDPDAGIARQVISRSRLGKPDTSDTSTDRLGRCWNNFAGSMNDPERCSAFRQRLWCSLESNRCVTACAPQKNRIGRRASASVPCRRFRRSTSPAPLYCGGSSDRYRDCLALYSGNSHWDRKTRNSRVRKITCCAVTGVTIAVDRTATAPRSLNIDILQDPDLTDQMDQRRPNKAEDHRDSGNPHHHPGPCALRQQHVGRLAGENRQRSRWYDPLLVNHHQEPLPPGTIVLGVDGSRTGACFSSSLG
jgi:hypothetical protein